LFIAAPLFKREQLCFFMKKHILISTFSLLAIIANAQDEKMITDRPGFTIDPATTEKKWIQAETGFYRDTEKKGFGLKNHFMQNPVLAIKYGVVKRVELRIITELATIREEAINGTDIYKGLNRVELGAKFNFLDGKGAIPKTSLIAHYHFNHLRTIFKDTIDGADFRLAFRNNISKTVSIRYNAGMLWRDFRFDPYFLYSLSPGFNFGERWFAFIEVYGYFWEKYHPMNSLGAGLAFYINDNLKVDASAGIGLSKLAPDNFYAFGASFRFRTSKKAE